MSDWVLIADDHPLMRQGLAIAVKAAFPGHCIVEVGTAVDAALEIAQRDTCSLILLDFHLPDARGYSAFLHLQDLAPLTPIVIVTAREDRALIESAKALDAAGYIIKTLTLDRMAHVLRRVMAGERYFPDT